MIFMMTLLIRRQYPPRGSLASARYAVAERSAPTRRNRQSGMAISALARLLLCALAISLLLAPAPGRAETFQGWLEALWPAAQQRGVSRATFDAATRGL